MLKISKNLLLVLYNGLFAITIIIAGMLYMQYRYFIQETKELVQVKESYYQHVDMLKRSLNESLSQESLEEPASEEDKKKMKS